MGALLFGLVGVAMGLFCMAISGPLAKLVTNLNIFIHQDADVLEAYRSMKLRRIRVVAKTFMVIGGVFAVARLIGWGFGVR